MTKLIVEIIPMLPFGMLNAFLVIFKDKALLVDTGLPNSTKQIERALHKHNLGWTDIRLTVLTHAHIDHAGSAVKVRALTKSDILAHRDEIPYCMGTPPLIRTSGIFGRLFLKTGAINRPFDYFSPDRIMDGAELDLADYGFPVRLLLTPGHTPGSISVLLNDDQAIIGDLLASGILLGGIALRNTPKQPPFEEDTAKVVEALERLIALGTRTFYIGHGGPLTDIEVKHHITSLRQKILRNR